MSREAENNITRGPLLLRMITALVAPGLFVGFTCITKSSVAESFAAVFATSLIIPPLVASVEKRRHRLWIVFCGVASISPALLLMPASVEQSVKCILIVAAVGIFIAGATSLLRIVSDNFTVIAMIITIGLLLWLPWPIWLSQRLIGHETVVNLLTAAHPLLAINGQLLDQAIWTERPLMYAWTALNQDVPFSIPTSIAWCVLCHGGVGLLAIIMSWLMGRHRRSSPASGKRGG